MENLDPVKDRGEFEKRLKSIFTFDNSFSKEDAINVLIKNDDTKKKEYKEIIESNEKIIQSYLEQWDAAKTYEEKVVVVGSVKK